MFENVAYLSFDFRNNHLQSLSPDLLYDMSEGERWEYVGTKVLKG